MLHLSTIRLLREWARWGESHNISYPSMSPMFGERALKAPLYGSGHIPPDVWQVEQSVCRVDWDYRHVIILRYQRHLTFGHIASRLKCQTRTARARVRTAEHAVHHELAIITRPNAYESVTNPHADKVVTL